jgi:hypothetical protein
MWRIAEQMEEENPAWIVVFGVYTGQFVAFPRFDAPTVPYIAAPYPAALMPHMRAAEAAKTRRAIASRPPATEPGDGDTITFRLAG